VNDGPDEPLTPAGEGFIAMHEWFTGMRAAGFTIDEAAAIVAAAVRQSGEGEQS
jgi:hypothetical protein